MRRSFVMRAQSILPWACLGIVTATVIFFGVRAAVSGEPDYVPANLPAHAQTDIEIAPVMLDLDEEDFDLHIEELEPEEVPPPISEPTPPTRGFEEPLIAVRYFPHPIPIFENMGDTEHVSIIPPQMRGVVEFADNWWRIAVYDELYWINIDFVPPTYGLRELLSPHDQHIGVYFKNLDTGFTFYHNPDRVFFSASINKLMHAFYTYTAAERGYIDMYALHTYRAADYWGGTGIIRFDHQVGTEFTTRELLYYSIVHSDNLAFRMLSRYMERIDFRYSDFMRELGVNYNYILTWYSQNASAGDAAIWLYAIHNYLESDSRYGHYLHDDMQNVALYSHPYFTRGRIWGGSADVNVELLHSDYDIAMKYGWAGTSFNVMGIVHAPSPYMVIILSNMAEGAHDLFEEISWELQAFNRRYFYNHTQYAH